MRNRIGVILSVAGVVLLIDPSTNWKPVADVARQLAEQLWPVALILLGAVLQSPKKTRKNRR